jgi:thiol:disulfide interchange protein DsbD
LGLLFNLDPEWHIYWQNPGDSGEPPQIEWKLPLGFRAGATQWPIPKRMGKPPIVDYGYEKQVMLIAVLQTPSGLRTGQDATFVAHVKWLACREICVPEKADVTLTLPVHPARAKKSAAVEPLFAAASKALPKPLPLGWKAEAVAAKDRFVLTLRTGKRISEAVFFPLEADQVENSSPQKVEPLDTGVRLTLIKSEQLLKPVASLKGVIVLSGGTAYLIAAAVK